MSFQLTERKTFAFGGGVIVFQEIEFDADMNSYFCYRHRLVIGAIASEWASFPHLSCLKMGDRKFVGCIDGRSIFPHVFEITTGLEKV